MKRKLYCIIIICVSVLFNLPGGVRPGHAIETMKMDTKDVTINTFFFGKKLTISGRIPAQEDVIIEISGKDTESAFDLKGRIGPFWMTKGKVVFRNVPDLYLLLLPENQNLEKEIQKMGLGMKRLENRAEISGKTTFPEGIFNMFRMLKEKEHLYKTGLGAVKYTDQKDGTKLFTAQYRLPPLIGIGSYQVVATTIDQGKIKNQIKDTFIVEEVGFVKLVDHLASERRILYGVLAVVIALVAGLAMGVIFKQSGDAH